MQDNLIDIIGPNGNSGQNNLYLIDCEELYSGRLVGDEMAIKVIDNGDGYIASTKKITLDGKAMNVVPTLQIVKKRFFLLN